MIPRAKSQPCCASMLAASPFLSVTPKGSRTLCSGLRDDPARRLRMGQAARDALSSDYSRDEAVTTWKILINRFRKPAIEAYREMMETRDGW